MPILSVARQWVARIPIGVNAAVWRVSAVECFHSDWSDEHFVDEVEALDCVGGVEQLRRTAIATTTFGLNS
jgi:hypothetical protein